MRVLVVDDNDLWCDMVVSYLERDEIECQAARSLAEARRKLADPFQIVVLDQQLPDGEGLALAEELIEDGGDTRILMVTGHPHLDDAVQALRLRIDDYLAKPVELEVVRHAVLRSGEALRLERIDRLEKRRTEQDRGRVRIVGRGLESVRGLVERIGHATCPVFITGETGSGKSLVAKAVHYVRGTDRPFVKLNCAALPEGLVESELFGVEKGAFTGATASRSGLFELADGGTLFLDEIGELSPAVQAKLLGVLEDGEARRVGGSQTRKFEVRIVAATNVDLEEAIEEGRFRRDLYFRLDIGRIEVPSLRHRPDDLPELIEILLERLGAEGARLAEGEIGRLARYDWPGNVRELRNVLERSVLLQEPDGLTPSDLLPDGTTRRGDSFGTNGGAPGGEAEPRALEEVERDHILAVLDHFGGHRQRTADALGIGVATLRRKLKELSPD